MSFGNRVTEKDIRDWLDNHDLIGRTAIVADLELHAIQRPGWVQVFRFRLRVKERMAEDSGNPDSIWLDRVGVVLDDERKKTQAQRTQIWIFDNEDQQAEKLEEVSRGMITCRNSNSRKPSKLIWLIGFVVFVLVALIVSSAFQ